MKKTLAIPFKVPVSAYGAAEIKVFIKKNTYKSFIFTLSLIASIAFIAISLTSKEKSDATYIAPTIEASLLKLETSDPNKDVPKPPSNLSKLPNLNSMPTGPTKVAGTPVPVDTNDIKSDLPNIGDWKDADITRSTPGNGLFPEGNDNIGNFTKNPEPNFEPEEKPKAVVKKEMGEDEAPDEHPKVDMSSIMENIEYPRIAREGRIEGKVRVKVFIDANGKVTKAVVVSSESKILEESALAAVKKAVYTPAIYKGKTVGCWLHIPIVFKLN